MENKRYYWLKLKEDFFDEKYVKALRRLPQGDSLVVVYLKMQLKSLKTEGIINYEGILPNSISELAMAIDEDENVVKLAVEALINFGTIERWENDTLYMVAMQELIGSETAVAARVRKHRALQSNTKALQSNSDETKCNTEKEIEKEIEIEIEIDKEIEIKKEKKESVNYQEIVNAYNKTCVLLPSVQKLSDKRKRAIKARLKKYSIEDFNKVFEKAQATPFLTGSNKRGWRANFDWLIEESNMIKVLEGYYDKTKGESNEQQNDGYKNVDEKLGLWI